MERVGVIGCGLMGSGIAEVCVLADLDVLVLEVDEAAIAAGRRRVETSLARAVQKGKLSGVLREQAVEHLRFTTEFGDLYDRELAIEAVAEDARVKVEVFERLDKVL